MDLIDTHAHIYLPEFDDDRAAVIKKAADAGVKKILLPAIDARTHPLMLEAEATYDACTAMMGLHPCSVSENWESELTIVKDWLKERSFVAVGEIGLDFYWDKTFAAQQYEAFERQIGVALRYDLPIVIHSRNATDECIKVVQKYPGLRGVFHCFSGNAEQTKKIIDLGFFLGIGGVVTFKNAGLDKVVEQVELNTVVLETDAPYLAPVPYRGKRNESSYLKGIAEKIASLKGMPVEKVAEITTQNAKTLFKLDG